MFYSIFLFVLFAWILVVKSLIFQPFTTCYEKLNDFIKEKWHHLPWCYSYLQHAIPGARLFCLLFSIHFKTFDGSINGFQVHFKVGKHLIWFYSPVSSQFFYFSPNKLNVKFNCNRNSRYLFSTSRTLYFFMMCLWLGAIVVMHAYPCFFSQKERVRGRAFNVVKDLIDRCGVHSIYIFSCWWHCCWSDQLGRSTLPYFKSMKCCLQLNSQCGNVLCHLIAIYI